MYSYCFHKQKVTQDVLTVKPQNLAVSFCLSLWYNAVMKDKTPHVTTKIDLQVANLVWLAAKSSLPRISVNEKTKTDLQV